MFIESEPTLNKEDDILQSMTSITRKKNMRKN